MARKPARDVAGLQAMLGIRAVAAFGPSQPGAIAIKTGTTVYSLGSVPANAFISDVRLNVSTPVVGMTSPTVSIGTRDPATGTNTAASLLAATAIDAAANTAGAGANLGYQANEVEITAVIGGTGVASAGRFDAMVSFYCDQD